MDITQLSNVDLLNHYADTVYRDSEDEDAKAEVLRRMDAGVGNRDDVAVEPSEHQR